MAVEMARQDDRPGAALRIVMLGPFGLRPKGTMLRRALPMARALAARGHRVTLIMPPWHGPAEAGRAWDDRVPGVRLEYVALAGLGLPGLGHAVVAARMARRALALEPDLVHAFKPKAYAGLAAWLLRWARRLPGAARPALVIDTDDWEGPGGWNDLEPYSAVQRRVFAWQERAGLSRHADAVTVASRSLESLVWAMGVTPERLAYLPNAVDDAPGMAGAAEGGAGSVDGPAGHGAALGLEAAPDPGATRPFTLLLYTRFFEFELVRPLALLERLRERQPAARLLVGGKGLFGEERRFMALAREMGLAEAVEDAGWVPPEALAALLARADLAIYPFDDTLVNRTKSAFKLLELMAAGLPVVAEDVGQNRELIEDRRSGRLVPPGDLDAFAAALAELAEDPVLRAALGEGARERVRKRFCWSRQVLALEALYADAVARAGGGGERRRGGGRRAIDG
ncbi:MAG: glycosyltransferase [Chloroflexi bacterium]|nr:glycosyltransferase [Chloroflexota bacterium]